MTANYLFCRSFWKMVWPVACLTALAPVAFGQIQDSNLPSLWAIASPHNTNPDRKLVSISPEGIREIAELSGHVLYGMNETAAAFLQTPAHKSRGESRLLVIDRKTSAILADTNVQGLYYPDMMKALNVERLAVRSKEFSIAVPLFDNNRFTVVEVNWKTGTVRALPVPFAPEAMAWEITALYSIPSGIAVERGAFLALFDPTRQKAMLALNNSGTDWRPTGKFYVVPGFGVVQSKRPATLYQITGEDCSTLISNPAGFPTDEINIDTHHPRVVQIIKGCPCLIWGENEPGVVNPDPFETRSISVIAIYDLKARKIVLRKSLGGDFSPIFWPNLGGQNIFFSNLQTGEIFCLNLESQKLGSFAKPGANQFECIAAN
jgi:hypothetical protein